MININVSRGTMERGKFFVITKNGVCYDFHKSNYRYTLDNLTFVFSSQLHLDKFIQKVQENRDIINYSLSRRFNFAVDVAELADVVLYRKIEKRGFLIITNKGTELCRKSLMFQNGRVQTKI